MPVVDVYVMSMPTLVLQLWPGPGTLAQQPEFVIREQLVGHHGAGPQHPRFDLPQMGLEDGFLPFCSGNSSLI